MNTSSSTIADAINKLESVLCSNPQAILTAPPGAGKTTRVPLALLNADWLTGKKIVMLEPRRIAARSAAHFMARQLGEQVGETVGYRVRMDSRISSQTRVEVVTEGILTRQLQNDPELAGVGIVIFDEFHERNLDSDLALALCLDIQGVLNPDLKVLVMSATLEVEHIARTLGQPVHIGCETRQYPVEIRYGGTHTPVSDIHLLAAEVLRAARDEDGSILIFVPGAADIRRLCTILHEQQPASLGKEWLIAPLYGGLSGAEQDQAIAPPPAGKRKIVVATDIAETSLTIEGVRIVIDTGLQKRPQFHPGTGLTKLRTQPISRASAEQRCGRAGRTEPGLCIRLWGSHATSGLVPSHRPEIVSSDLSSLVLELALWGVSDPSSLRWTDPPPKQNLQAARELLCSLGALSDDFTITEHGKKIAALPLHPRLAHMVLQGKENNIGRAACLLAALLVEKDPIRFDRDQYQADLMVRIESIENFVRGKDRGSMPRVYHGTVDMSAVRRIAATADDLRKRLSLPGDTEEPHYGRLLAWAYPERIAMRRTHAETSYLLAGGQGAFLERHDDLTHHEWLVVCDLDGNRNNARIFKAIGYDRESLYSQFAEKMVWKELLQWDAEKGSVSAEKILFYNNLQLASEPLQSPDPEAISEILMTEIRKSDLSLLPWDRRLRSFRERVIFVRNTLGNQIELPDLSDDHLAANLEQWLAPFLNGVKSARDLAGIDLRYALTSMLSYAQQEQLEKLAPSHYVVPSGSKIPIDYSGETPILAVRLQEMFGLDQTPSICTGRCQLLLHLLSPAGRPLQITSDLAGFWNSSYEDVKKDMKGRYPKHYWPDDPLSATPTNRAKPRIRK